MSEISPSSSLSLVGIQMSTIHAVGVKAAPQPTSQPSRLQTAVVPPASDSRVALHPQKISPPLPIKAVKICERTAVAVTREVVAPTAAKIVQPPVVSARPTTPSEPKKREIELATNSSGSKPIVGQRIRVFWPDDSAWYSGRVTALHGRKTEGAQSDADNYNEIDTSDLNLCQIKTPTLGQ